MLKKILLKSMASLFVIVAVSGCGNIELSNQTWCADAGSEGAACFETLSDKEWWLTKEQWDIDRKGQVCANPMVYAEIEAAILSMCRMTRRCTYDAKKKLVKFVNKIESRIEYINALQPVGEP